MKRSVTATSPLLKVATCFLGAVALVAVLLPAGLSQTAGQSRPATATLTAYHGTPVNPGSEQCWHVYHYERVFTPGLPDNNRPLIPPVNVGTLFFAVDVCNDGTHAYLQPNRTALQSPGCWTNDGPYGSATLTSCGASPNSDGSLTLYGTMNTKGAVPVIKLLSDFNIESNDMIQTIIPASGGFQQDTATGSSDVWWAGVSVDSPFPP